MSSYDEGRASASDTQHMYDYKPKLLGILPQDFLYKKPTRWETRDLFLCKPPSQQHWMCGPLLNYSHPSLTGTAILEKKSNVKDSTQQDQDRQPDNYDKQNSEEHRRPSLIHLESKLSNLLTDHGTSATTTNEQPHLLDCVYQYSSSSSIQQYTKTEGTSPSTNTGGDSCFTDDDVGGTSVESEELIKNVWNSGSVTMKFLKNNFQPELDSLPDFTCNRNVLVNLMTESKDFVIQATKQTFTSRMDSTQKEYATIELFFRPIQFEDVSSKSARIAAAIQSQQQIPNESGRQNESSSKESSKDMNWRTRHLGSNFYRLRSHRNSFESHHALDQHSHYGHGDGNCNRNELTSSRPFTAEEYALYEPSTLRMVNQVTNIFNRSWDSVPDFITTDVDTESKSSLDVEEVEGSSEEVHNALSSEAEVAETPYYAFVQGKLTRANTHRQELRQSFTFNIGSYLDGVWTNKRNPYNYTCTDLAEIKTAKSSTLQGHGAGRDFYKQVRMAQNWSQTYLAGLKQYMVGVTIPTESDSGENTIEELLLYSVDKIPQTVRQASELQDFKPWTPEELKSRLFTYLLFINNVMASQPFNVSVNLFHYEGESFLTTMTNAEVHDEIKCLQDVRKRVILKGLLPPPPMAIEERQNAYSEVQIKTILTYIKWPIRQFGKPFVRRFSRDVHLTFESDLIANAFARLVKNVWRQKINIPPGFEKLWVEMKPPLTRRHDHALAVQRRGNSGVNIGATGDCVNNNIQNPLMGTTSRFANYMKPGLLGNAPNAPTTSATGLYPRSMWSTHWNETGNLESAWRQ